MPRFLGGSGMKISLRYGTPPRDFEASVDSIVPKPIELAVENVGDFPSQARSLQFYVQSLKYLFQGVTNMVTGNLLRLSVEKSWFGKIERDGFSIKWEPRIDKFFVVVYSLGDAKLDEDMYVADVVYSTKSGRIDTQPVWLNSLLNQKSKAAAMEKEHLTGAIAAVTKHIGSCSLVYTNDKLTVIDRRRKKQIQVEDIPSDEVYVLVRLIYRILSKGLHQGVFFVNGRYYSDNVINALVDLSRFIYGDCFIFLYNLSADSRVDRAKFVLPNLELSSS
jgi:hypothetical protein